MQSNDQIFVLCKDYSHKTDNTRNVYEVLDGITFFTKYEEAEEYIKDIHKKFFNSTEYDEKTNSFTVEYGKTKIKYYLQTLLSNRI